MLSYFEIVQKIVDAKNLHIDAMQKTKAATVKFLEERKKFHDETIKIYTDQLLKTDLAEKIAPKISSGLSYFLSNEVNEPVIFEEICSFFQNSFLPLISEVERTYTTCFDESYSKISPFINELQNARNSQNEAQMKYNNTCKEIEELNKNHSSKKLEDKYNNLCFEYKNIRQNLIDSINTTDDKNKAFYIACDKFLFEFEQIDHDRHEQLQTLFLTLTNAIERVFSANDKIKHEVNEKAKLLEATDSIETAYKDFELPETTELSIHSPVIDLSFDYTQFLDVKTIFAPYLSQRYAHATVQISKNGMIVAEAGDRVIIRSKDEGIALISNLDDSLRTTVALEAIEERPEFERYLAVIEEGPDKNHIVCVIAGGEHVEVINEWGLVNFVKAEHLKKIEQ